MFCVLAFGVAVVLVPSVEVVGKPSERAQCNTCVSGGCTCGDSSASAMCVTKRRNGRPVDTSRKLSMAHAQASNGSPPLQANNTTQRQSA